MREQRTLRVVHLALEWPDVYTHAGGVGRYVYRLVSVLRDDVSQIVITGGAPQPLDGVQLVPHERRGRFGRYYAAPLTVTSLVRSLHPDVVHAHGDDWALRTSSPVLRTFYGSSAGEAKSGGSLLRRTNHALLAGLEQISARRADLSVAIADESRRRFRASAVVPPILPPSGDWPSTPKSTRAAIVFVGGFHGRKRGELALQVATAVRQVFPDLIFSVVGPERDRAHYPPWVSFHSGLQDAEVAAVVQEAWVLIAPSAYEGFGIPLVEALSLGTPVVATPNPGADEVLDHGGFGKLVQDAELPRAVSALLADRGLREQMQAAGLRRAHALLVAGDARHYVNAYRQLVRHHHKGLGNYSAS